MFSGLGFRAGDLNKFREPKTPYINKEYSLDFRSLHIMI